MFQYQIFSFQNEISMPVNSHIFVKHHHVLTTPLKTRHHNFSSSSTHNKKQNQNHYCLFLTSYKSTPLLIFLPIISSDMCKTSTNKKSQLIVGHVSQAQYLTVQSVVHNCCNSKKKIKLVQQKLVYR